MYQTEKVLAEEAKEMRAVFAEVMEELVQQDRRVVYLDADVINSIGMTGFWKSIPLARSRPAASWTRCSFLRLTPS